MPALPPQLLEASRTHSMSLRPNSLGKTGRAMTPEPGDLPRRTIVHGRGVSVAAAAGVRTGLLAPSLSPTPQSSGYRMALSQQIPVATLGVPRIGRRRELKFALESYWSGKSCAAELLATAKALRAASWEEQRDRGVSKIPSNDFSLYDHVLDTAAMVGAVPSRYAWNGGEIPLDIYFAMARGNQGQAGNRDSGREHAACPALTAMEMTKWFDTNYH